MEAEEQNQLTNNIHISSTNNEHSLDQSILNIIAKEGYVTYDITKKQLQQDGGNYLGVLYEVDVKGKTKEDDKTTAIFVKTMPVISGDIGVSLLEVYDREKFIYFELSKIFDKMQNEALIPEEKRFKMVMSYDEVHPKALFLENIARKGFRTWFRMDIITLDYAEECIKELARFHGLSFALEKKQTDYFNRFIKPLKFGTKPGKEHNALVDSVRTVVLEQLDQSIRSHLEDELRPLMKKFMENVTDTHDVCCLCHGDYRSNNIMHKTVKGRVTEVVPVDYQFAYYGCLVLDIIYFIYSSTDHRFRKDHLPYLQDLYHETLTDFLNYFNISIDSVLSKNTFDELYEKKKEFGLSIFLLLGPFMFTEEEESIDLIDVKDHSRIVLDNRYKERLHDVIKEFYTQIK